MSAGSRCGNSNYDKVGNLTEVVHGAGGSTQWTRTHSYEPGSNRLVSTVLVSATSGTITEDYVHDDRGSLTYLPTLRFSSGGTTANIETSFRDQMVHALLPTSGHEAFYAYNAAGQRVRKRVVTSATSERFYVGGWEVYREYNGSGDIEEERSTFHVADGAGSVLLVETKTFTRGAAVTSPDPVLRYQLGDHLGTVAIELDEDGGLVSYEEYHPYGTTAWWAGDSALVSQKRYKFTGMERDEETGLQCHGRRYYAAWLGRWTGADPIGLGDGVNRFVALRCAPSRHIDHTGMATDDPQQLSAVLYGPILPERNLPNEIAVDSDIAEAISSRLYASQRENEHEASGVLTRTPSGRPNYRHDHTGHIGDVSPAVLQTALAILSGEQVLMQLHSHPVPSFPSAGDVIGFSAPRLVIGKAIGTYGETKHGAEDGAVGHGRLTFYLRTAEYEAGRRERHLGLLGEMAFLQRQEILVEATQATLVHAGVLRAGQESEDFGAAYFAHLTGLAAYAGSLSRVSRLSVPDELGAMIVRAVSDPGWDKEIEDTERWYQSREVREAGVTGNPAPHTAQ